MDAQPRHRRRCVHHSEQAAQRNKSNRRNSDADGECEDQGISGDPRRICWTAFTVPARGDRR